MSEILINKVIFKKYKILKIIGKGAFGYVFLGKNIVDGKNVAIKVEDWKKQGDFLEGEAYFLFQLKGIGSPEVKSFGVCGKYKVLVETLLGNSIEKIFNRLNNKFTLKDICMIGIQLIERLEYIHSKYIIHRDIKPENILTDLESKRYIYLIDFGIAKRYRSGRTGNHIKFSLPKRFTGNARYSSKNALRGCEQSRRDDLESVGYILIYLAKNGNLPWQGLKIKNIMERFKQIYLIKKYIEPEKLCFGLPSEFSQYVRYVNQLKFEEDPNYQFLKGLFINTLTKAGLSNDMNFSWLTTVEKNYDINKLTINNYRKKKTSPQSRILHNIENKEKNISNNNENKKYLDLSENLNKYNMHRDNSYSNLENKSEKSGTQLTQINTSINIAESELNESIKDKNLNKNNSEKQIQNTKNSFKDKLREKLYQNNISKIDEKNKINQSQSIPIIFDPVNGSFNSLFVLNQNNLRNINTFLNKINKINNNNNDTFKNDKISDNDFFLTNKQERSLSINSKSKSLNNKEIKNTNNKNNFIIQKNFFEIKKIKDNDNDKDKKQIKKNNEKKILLHYKEKKNIANSHKDKSLNNKCFNNNKISCANNYGRNLTKKKFFNNRKIIELDKANIKLNGSDRNNKFKNKMIYNTNDNRKNINKNNGTSNFYYINNINKKLILNTNLINNIMDQKSLNRDKKININKFKNIKSLTTNNSLTKNNNILNQYNKIGTADANNKIKTIYYRPQLIRNATYYDYSQNYLNNLELNKSKKISKKYSPHLCLYTTPESVKKYKYIKFDDDNFNEKDLNEKYFTLKSRYIENGFASNNIVLPFKNYKLDSNSVIIRNKFEKLKKHNLKTCENNYLAKSETNIIKKTESYKRLNNNYNTNKSSNYIYRK